ncbi:hypothetical protein TNCT_408791 [Trichonephila clavata]|uniref:Uncharacterized protein n=1 Tax=Trichonephila clavata TaxID=2740835 RepID=A0A8X6HR92_TRICU|nr:hypothetical protein TNCT_408791 [Trichonephila clavata]
MPLLSVASHIGLLDWSDVCVSDSPTARKWRRPYACSDSPFYSRDSLLSPAFEAHLPTKTLKPRTKDSPHRTFFALAFEKNFLVCRVVRFPLASCLRCRR